MTGLCVVETAELYDGEILVELNEASHRYKVDGDYKIGVTTVIGVLNKPELLLWPLNECLGVLKAQLKPDRHYTELELEELLEHASKAHTRKSDKGKDAGTLVHDYIEGYLTEQEPARFTHNPQADRAINAFHDFLEQFNPQMIHAERIVYSRTWDYAGKLDLVAEINGQTALLDFKTNNRGLKYPEGIYPEHYIQLAGYAVALEEEIGLVPDLHMIVNLDKKTGTFRKKTRNRKSAARDKETFLNCLNLYNNLKELRSFVQK